jgi:tetratricopeptide (TPR) repeat protein
MSCPVINPELLLAPSEEGYVVYHPRLDRIYRLNPVGALIAELCDGKRTPDLIHDLLDPVLPPESRVEIGRWIEQGLEAGLLTSAADASASGSPLSAQELIALAEKLRDQGKVLPAFICQLRATELDGENPSTWLKLGEFAHIVGRRDDSLLAYERYLELYPQDAEARHIVAALRGGATPSRASGA